MCVCVWGWWFVMRLEKTTDLDGEEEEEEEWEESGGGS